MTEPTTRTGIALRATRSRGQSGAATSAGSAAALDEQRLVELARTGDREAFEQLVRLHASGLFAVVVRLCASAYEAEEVTQEAFLRAWRGVSRFQGESSFFTWLYRIGVNEAKRRAARQASQPTSSLDDDPGYEAVDARPTPDVRAEHEDLRSALEAAVVALHPDYRAPLILRDIEGLSTEEAARVLDLSEPAFKSRLHRARLKIREAMTAYLEDQR